MVVIDHVEKIARSKVTVTTPPAKVEQPKAETESKRGRKAKEE